LTDRVRYHILQQREADAGMDMLDAEILWDLEDGPGGNVSHLAEHGVTVDEAESVLRDPRSLSARSRRTGLPQAFGWTHTGKFITVIWEEVNDDPRMIYPTTAYEVPPPLGRRR
jgi:hypothetical protein